MIHIPHRYRAWNPKTKDMTEVGNGDVDSLAWDLDNGFDNDWILLRTTGQPDREGVEVFEGDIIQYENGFRQVVEFGLVEFRNAVLNGRDVGDFSMIGFKPNYEAIRKGKVIGNKYENPDEVETKEEEINNP